MDNNTENDLRILKALYFGNHLNSQEIKRVKEILKQLRLNLNLRVL